MSEIAINYKSSTIASMDSSGTKTLLTEGKYCEDDITIVYTRPSGGGGTPMQIGKAFASSNTSSITFTGILGEPTSFYIISDASSMSLPSGTPYTIAGVVYDGTNVIGQAATNASNAQASYSTDFTMSYSSGSLTVSSTSLTFSGDYGVNYTYGGTASDIHTADVQVESGTTSITFTDLEDEPDFFCCIFKSNFSTSSGYQRVMMVTSNNYGACLDSSVHFRQAWTHSYSSGSLTISSNGTNNGGYFHQPGYYQLTYAISGDQTLQTKTVTPTTSTQDVTADTLQGYTALKKVVVEPIPSAYVIPSGTMSITSNGSGIDVASYASVDVSVIPTLQTKSIAFTPAETLQTSSVTYDAGYDGLSAVDVSVAAISSTYVGSGVPTKSSADMTRNKRTITAPSGYYSEAAIYSMSDCAALLTQSVDANGLVTAVYSIITAGYQASGSMTHTTQLSSIGATTYTPSTAAQTISSQYFLTGTQTIEAIPSAYVIPTGTSSITSNGIYDITAFASVDVQVSGGGGSDAEDGIIMRTISGTYENSTATKIGSYAFYYCKSLTTASFPNATDTSIYAFAYCTSLTTASFPELTTIESYTFQMCTYLTTVSFPKAQYIGSYAFTNCLALETASFPSAKKIYSAAFSKCYKLLSLYLLGSTVVTLSNANAFNSTPISTYTTSTGGVNGSIYVPASLYSTYKGATNWQTYSARFVSV